MVGALASVTGRDVRLNSKKLATSAADLVRAGYTPGQVSKFYGEGQSWWYRSDWRGGRGQKPTLAAINETIQAAKDQEKKEPTASPIQNSDRSYNL